MPFKIKKNRRILLIASSLLIIGAGLFYAFTAYGVTRTWDGGGADANWNTAANWSGDTAPVATWEKFVYTGRAAFTNYFLMGDDLCNLKNRHSRVSEGV